MESDPYVLSMVREVAYAADIDEADVTLDARFEDLGVDSLDAIGIIANLEDEFDVEVPNDQLKGLETVRQAVNVLRRAGGLDEVSS